MKPDQALRAACEQLRLEMPKATYDSWVGEIALVSYDEGEFVIGAANEFNRDWLEGRLTSTLTRLLTGLMNRSVQVQFIISQTSIDEMDDVEEDPEEASEKDEERDLKIQLAQASLRDDFVHPNRVVVIPGYFQRWLLYLGPTLAWIVVAFRQAMFMTTHREARAGFDFEVSPASVARWAGINRSTLWRHLDDWMLGWFLKRTSREANTFRFVACMPLTPGDADALYDWLLGAGIRSDPVAVLEKSLSVDRAYLFPDPQPLPVEEHLQMKPEPQSVQDIVLKACGRIDKKAILTRVMELADQLALRLLPPGDAIHVTQYFLLQHLPVLGAASAWFVTLLRDRCYVDRNNLRDTVWMRGGYTEIARMLGLQRPKTISEWLPPAFESKAIPRPPDAEAVDRTSAYEHRSGLRQERRSIIIPFVRRIDFATNTNATAWNFQVSLVEPLSAEDQALYDRIIDLVGNFLESGDRHEIDAILLSGNLDEARLQHAPGGTGLRRGAIATPSNQDEARMQHDEARMQRLCGANATCRGADATGMRRDCNTERRECNALNSLNRLLKLLEQPVLNPTNSSDSSTETEADPESVGRSVVVVDPAWDLIALFSRNPSIKADTQRTLLTQQASPQALVSWLLYAASPDGTGITRPLLFAASKLLQVPQAGAGNICDRLAALPPRILAELLEGSLSGTQPSITVLNDARADWQALMRPVSTERMLALKHQLFG